MEEGAVGLMSGLREGFRDGVDEDGECAQIVAAYGFTPRLVRDEPLVSANRA